MAKRIPPRSKADDTTSAAEGSRAAKSRGAGPRGRRAVEAGAPDVQEQIPAMSDTFVGQGSAESRPESDAAALATGGGEGPQPVDLTPSSDLSEAAEAANAQSDANTSTPMGSEPSEEDIRMRAYHRYLERGGGHGMDFDDWCEAERELRRRS